MIGTNYLNLTAKIDTVTIATNGLTTSDQNYDFSRTTVLITTASTRRVVLAPGANLTLDLPDAPCYVMLRAHRHETDPDDADLAITDPLIMHLTGAVAVSGSELIVRIEEGAVQ